MSTWSPSRQHDSALSLSICFTTDDTVKRNTEFYPWSGCTTLQPVADWKCLHLTFVSQSALKLVLFLYTTVSRNNLSDIFLCICSWKSFSQEWVLSPALIWMIRLTKMSLYISWSTMFGFPGLSIEQCACVSAVLLPLCCVTWVQRKRPKVHAPNTDAFL